MAVTAFQSEILKRIARSRIDGGVSSRAADDFAQGVNALYSGEFVREHINLTDVLHFRNEGVA